MTVPPQKYFSEEEYLELEREAGYKSEYYRGEIFAMAGAGHNHSSIPSLQVYGGLIPGPLLRKFFGRMRKGYGYCPRKGTTLRII